MQRALISGLPPGCPAGCLALRKAFQPGSVQAEVVHIAGYEPIESFVELLKQDDLQGKAPTAVPTAPPPQHRLADDSERPQAGRICM